ncbi:aspartate/glutamate racemase family protein [[Eubacterium] cellulosolvens]
MKIGILGGLSPESTSIYYNHIIREYAKRYSDYNYPEIIIYSVNFQEFINWQNQERWDLAAKKMIEIFNILKNAGADLGLIATNTMHIVFDEVQNEISMPLLNIIKSTAEFINKEKITTVGLLGTIFTMSKDFYKQELKKNGIATLVPEKEEQELINKIIFQELTKGIILPKSKAVYVKIINKLRDRGAQGIILGCTEIPLLVKEEDCRIRLYDTTKIHAEKALNYATNSL